MKDPQGRQVFTLAQANDLVPTLKMRFSRIFAHQARLREVGQELKSLGVDSRAGQWRPNPRDTPHSGRLKADFARFLDETNHELAAIHMLGALVKDLHQGHVDFPALIGGKPAFFCWQYGEDEVLHWHQEQATFVQREPIDPGRNPTKIH